MIPNPRDYVPLPDFPIVPSKRGLQRVQDADFIIRLYESFGSAETEPEDIFLDWGSTLRLRGQGGREWILEFVEVIEREVGDERASG